MVKANGDLVECSQNNNPELFDAARVSMGSLGVITEIEVQNQKSFHLQHETWAAPIDDLLAEADTLRDEYRNYECYYIPHTGYGLGIGYNETSDTEVVRQPDTSSDDIETLRLLNKYLGWSRQLFPHLCPG